MSSVNVKITLKEKNGQQNVGSKNIPRYCV